MVLHVRPRNVSPMRVNLKFESHRTLPTFNITIFSLDVNCQNKFELMMRRLRNGWDLCEIVVL